MSLVVWLPLNGDLRNQGCSNIEVTNNGATVDNSGKIGKCYHFGTSNSYIQIPKEAMTTFTTDCSISFWFKINTWNSSYATFFQAGLGSIPWTHYIFGFLRNSTNSTICFTISNGSSASNASYLTSTIELNKWYHITLTYTTGKCKIYLNGLLDHEYVTSIIPAFSSITTITLGRGNSNNYQTDCNINDFRIYDHCLSAAEVHEIAMGLVLHYKLDKNKSQLANVYSYPTFDTSSFNGGWSHWGRSGASGAYGQNTDKKYIWNKNNTYSHWVSNSSSATGHYLLYQSPAFDGGYRSAQCIVKEENGLPITTSIVYAAWNAQSGGLTNETFSSITHLGDGFYLCKAEGIKQDGSNDLVGFYVRPGYKVYFSEAYLENNKEMCSDIFGQDNLTTITDSSGYGHNGIIVGTSTSDTSTPRYNNSLSMNNTGTSNHIETNAFTLPDVISVSFWAKANKSTNQVLFADPLNSIEFGFLNSLAYIKATYAAGWTTANFINNEWNHIVVEKNGSTFYLYINGMLETQNGASNYYTHNGTKLWLLNRSANNNYAANASISDFRIYCTPLLDNDIKMLYNVGMKVDNLGGVHTFEFEENKSNIFRSELIMPVAKAGRTARIGEIVEHNGYYAMNIAPEPFYKNISDSVSGFLQGYFYTNTSYIFDLWIDVDSVIYNGNNFAGGLSIIFTDGSSDNSFVFTGGNKGWQHKKIITPSNKTIDRLSVWYYTSTDVFYRLDSYICPISSTKIIKQGILDITNITENSEIASIYKGGSIYSSEFIEI